MPSCAPVIETPIAPATAPPPPPFTGFPRAGLEFLTELAANNTTAWFNAHQHEYSEQLVEPARALVVALAARVHRFEPRVVGDPEVGGSILALERPSGAAAEQRPYLEHLDVWLSVGGSGRECPGFSLRLDPRELTLGAGMHRFSKPFLARYRRAVMDDRDGAALDRAIDAVGAARSCELRGRHFKRVPAGFDSAHPRAALLLHEGLYAAVTAPLPPELARAEFIEHCAAHYTTMAPVVRWLSSLQHAA